MNRCIDCTHCWSNARKEAYFCSSFNTAVLDINDATKETECEYFDYAINACWNSLMDRFCKVV